MASRRTRRAGRASAVDPLEVDRRRQALAVHRLPLNGAHDIQAGDDRAERRRALPIVEPRAAVVQRRLIVQVNDEAGPYVCRGGGL